MHSIGSRNTLLSSSYHILIAISLDLLLAWTLEYMQGQHPPSNGEELMADRNERQKIQSFYTTYLNPTNNLPISPTRSHPKKEQVY